MATAPRVQIAQFIEHSGSEAGAGDNWRNGVEFAIQDINASGGLLGRMIEITTYDTQSSPPAAHRSATRGIDSRTYAVLGPLEPATARAVASVAAERRVAMLACAELEDIAPPASAFVFRTDLALATRFSRLTAYVRDRVRPKRIGLVWAASDAGRSIRDAFAREAQSHGLNVVLALPVDAHGTNLAADTMKLAAAGVDGIFVGLNEAESTYFVAEIRRHSPSVAIFGESPLISQPGIDRLGPDANGLIAHVGPEAGVGMPSLSAFHDRYAAHFGTPADRGAVAGYVAVAAIKAVTTMLGRVDRAALPDGLRSTTITTQMEPSILLSSRWDASGALDRDSFIVEVHDEKPRVVRTIGLAGG